MRVSRIILVSLLVATLVGLAITFLPTFSKVRGLGEIVLLIGVGGLIRSNAFVKQAAALRQVDAQEQVRSRPIDTRLEVVVYATFFLLFAVLMILDALGTFYSPLTYALEVALAATILVFFVNRIL